MHEIRKMLLENGCLWEGEFFFALKKPGWVSKKYINLDPLLTNPQHLMTIAKALIEPFSGQFNCLVGPAVGGIPLTYTAALVALTDPSRPSPLNCLSTAFAEKHGEDFKFSRQGFTEAVAGRKVLLLEDITSSGDTTRKVASVVRQAGGEPIGVSLIWNRGPVTPEMTGTPRLEAVITESVKVWDIRDDPPGWGKLPLVKNIGHPEYFPDYQGGYLELSHD